MKEFIEEYGIFIRNLLLLGVVVAFVAILVFSLNSRDEELIKDMAQYYTVAPTQTEETTEPVVVDNIFDGYEWTYGQTIDRKNGQLKEEQSNAVSDAIPVSENKEYILQCEFSSIAGRRLYMAYYNAEGAFVRFDVSTAQKSLNRTWVFEVPAGAGITSVRLNLMREDAEESVVMPVATSVFDVLQLQDAGYAMAGMTMLNFGDSIAAGEPETECRSYAYQIADRNYMHLISKAIGGSTMSTHEGWEFDILSQVDRVDASVSADFILLNGLTNEAYPQLTKDPAMLGEISEGMDAQLNTSTFCGGFEATVKKIQEKWPDAKLIYVTAHVNSSRVLEAQEKLTNLAIKMCQKWNVPVADVFHNSGFNSFESDQKKVYIQDGSHPNELGYTKYYLPVILAKMREVLAQ